MIAIGRAGVPGGPALDEVAAALGRFGGVVRGDGSVRVVDVDQDSRRVGPGALFVARADDPERRRRHVEQALSRGAAAVLAGRGKVTAPEGVAVLEVDDVRAAVGFAAEAVHGHPSRALQVLGVTGTNGKTTVTWLAEQVLGRAGARAARLGTLGYSFGADRTTSPLTTPEADDVTRWMARARDSGATHFAMEVSSHALVQARVEAIAFRAALFTNLTQDHLDFHGDMESYGRAKRRLFLDLEPASSVVNVTDAFGARLAGEIEASARPVVRVARDRVDGADVWAEDATFDARGTRARVRLPRGHVTLTTGLVGQHNLDNALAVLALVEVLALDVQAALASLEGLYGAPGRLERCDGPADDVVVLVDYAHTPDALARALEACRRIAKGRVTCVFGCGGDRDPDKRPKMGRAVAVGADRAIVTNDNPRTEAPEAIVRAIVPGLAGARFDVVLDRAAAIDLAVNEAEAGDVVLIAGKGHEPYQLIGGKVLDFDDRVEARRALAARRGESG